MSPCHGSGRTRSNGTCPWRRWRRFWCRSTCTIVIRWRRLPLLSGGCITSTRYAVTAANLFAPFPPASNVQRCRLYWPRCNRQRWFFPGRCSTSYRRGPQATAGPASCFPAIPGSCSTRSRRPSLRQTTSWQTSSIPNALLGWWSRAPSIRPSPVWTPCWTSSSPRRSMLHRRILTRRKSRARLSVLSLIGSWASVEARPCHRCALLPRCDSSA